MIASTSEQQQMTTSSFVNNKTSFIKEEREENIKEADGEENNGDKQVNAMRIKNKKIRI
ncbi:unnamed protein product [Meloidogyne enterolobii]|uniref:Uncharacterized protein n=1 Tax=Meloidogyne enterolobii TaxID=390850 RepID=A0ACB1AGM3_MELEN